MSQATVRIPTPLRGFTGGAGEVPVEGATVGEVLRVLGDRHTGLAERILDGEGRLRNFVNVFVNDQNVRVLAGLESSVPDGAVINIVPAVAGGTPANGDQAAGGTPANGDQAAGGRP